MAEHTPLSLIIPCLNEAEIIREQLLSLQPLRKQGAEVILVDGGSCDNTIELAAELVDQVLRSPPGRALQMNHGAASARGSWLLFLHADTRLPEHLSDWQATIAGSDYDWGFFTIRLSGSHILLRCVERMISWRSRISAIATGDQCLFIRRSCFAEMGGYADIALMEDVELCTRLKKKGRPLLWPQSVISSSRRWEQRGILRTITLMWWLRAAYALGVSPARLRRWYL